tara:strand:+ start:255 stop:518 length:264 start_codon:yes stop_codon:yes gene_type:complete
MKKNRDDFFKTPAEPIVTLGFFGPRETFSYQDKADMTQPYQVRTGCGHIVTRRMRPSTARVPYTPETIIEAPGGAPCAACEKTLEVR